MDDISVPVFVKGRLQDNLDFWKDVLHVSPSVLRIIEYGYVLPLMSEPTQFKVKNQSSALENVENNLQVRASWSLLVLSV